MIEVPRSLYRAGLIAVLAASVFTFGCNKKPKTGFCSAAARRLRRLLLSPPCRCKRAPLPLKRATLRR